MLRRALLPLCFLLLVGRAWAQNIDGQAGGGASLTVKENDNNPTVSNVQSISFTNGTLSDDGGGNVSVTISGTWVTTYLTAHLQEAKRLRRVYGRAESPIYPYVWWRRADDLQDLDHDVWETIVRTVLEEADGLVLWGGWKVTAPTGPLPWDENAPWWVTIKARLTDKRRTG